MQNIKKRVTSSSTRMVRKLEFIKNHINEFFVKKMYKIQKVSTNAYYKWLHKILSKRELKHMMLIEEFQ